MYDHRLNADLGRLHRLSVRDELSEEFNAGLERRLRSRFRDRYTPRRRWLVMFNPWNRNTRAAGIGMSLLLLTVAACTTSTTTELDLGKQMTIGFAAQADADRISVDTGVARFLETLPGIEKVSVSINHEVGQPAVVEATAWGQNLDPHALLSALQRQIPELKPADISFADLTGTIRESFAARMQRIILHPDPDQATTARIRSQVWAQLESQGMTGRNAKVQVFPDGSPNGVHVEISPDEGP